LGVKRVLRPVNARGHEIARQRCTLVNMRLVEYETGAHPATISVAHFERGAEIVRQRSFAARFEGCATAPAAGPGRRIPARELGLIELHMNRGAVVAELSPQRAWEIFSLRAVLEPFAARLALTAGRMRNADRETIRVAFRRIEESVLSGDQYAIIEADMEFHWSICALCRHEILLNHLRSLQVQMRQFMFYTKILDSDPESEVNSHRPVLAAVLSGDADRAEAALHRHIAVAGEQLLVRMSEVGAERPGRIAHY
jgi:DNA-binding GntR family transcriptional regulator